MLRLTMTMLLGAAIGSTVGLAQPPPAPSGPTVAPPMIATPQPKTTPDLTPLSPVKRWAAMVLADGDQPDWKHAMAQRIQDGTVTKVPIWTTFYSPDDALDPGTGGGPNSAWGGVLLRHGYIAADWSHWPKGTVFYFPPNAFTGERGRSMIVTDNGPAVRGAQHIDVCCFANTYKLYRQWVDEDGTRLKVWGWGG